MSEETVIGAKISPSAANETLISIWNTKQIVLATVFAAPILLPLFQGKLSIPAVLICLPFIVFFLSFKGGVPLMNIFINKFLFILRKMFGQTKFNFPLSKSTLSKLNQSNVTTLNMPSALGEKLKIMPMQLDNNFNGGYFYNLAKNTATVVLDVPSSMWKLDSYDNKLEKTQSFVNLLKKTTDIDGIEYIAVQNKTRDKYLDIEKEYERVKNRSLSKTTTDEYLERLKTFSDVSADNQTSELNKDKRCFVEIIISKNKLKAKINDLGNFSNAIKDCINQFLSYLASCLSITDKNIINQINWLSPSEIKSEIRTSFDPSMLRFLANNNVDINKLPLITSLEEYTNELQSSGTFFRTFVIESWSHTQVKAGFLEDIISTYSDNHTFTMLFFPNDIEKAIKKYRRQVNSLSEKMKVDEKLQRQTNPKHFEEQDMLEQKKWEIASGFGDTRFVGLVTISANSKRQLNLREKELNQQLPSAKFTVLSNQQYSAFCTCQLPLGLEIRN
jgi:hypothetical protein